LRFDDKNGNLKATFDPVNAVLLNAPANIHLLRKEMVHREPLQSDEKQIGLKKLMVTIQTGSASLDADIVSRLCVTADTCNILQ